MHLDLSALAQCILLAYNEAPAPPAPVQSNAKFSEDKLDGTFSILSYISLTVRINHQFIHPHFPNFLLIDNG